MPNRKKSSRKWVTTKQAQETMDEASQLDPDSERVKETSAKVALNAKDTNTAKQIMSQLKAMENVVSYMNNQAVALARCEMVQDGISQYKKTIEAIPDSRQDITSIVNYNLGLAYIRASDMKSAVDPLDTASKLDSNVKERAGILLKKLQKAIEKGKPLVLQKPTTAIPEQQGSNEAPPAKEGEEPQELLDSAKTTVLTLMQATAGEMACHLVFQPNSLNPKAQKMLSGQIRFNPREAITKDASGGADKLMAASA